MNWIILILKVVHSAIFWAFAQVLFFVTYLLSLISFLIPRIGHLILRFILINFIRFGFLLGLIRVKVIGYENLKDNQSTVLISNLSGVMDPLFLIAYLPVNFRFLAEKAMFDIPLLRTCMHALHYIVIPKDNRKAMLFAKNIYGASKRKESILIFPEVATKKGEFQEGALKIARSLSWPIIPVIIKGSQRVFPENSLIITPGVVKIVIGKPLDPHKTTIEELYKNF